MLNLFQHPFRGRLGGVIDKQPCVYILANKPYGTLYIGVTSEIRSGQTLRLLSDLNL